MNRADVPVGEHIRQIRQNQGLTQKAFADSLGITQGMLSNIERGRKQPSDTLLIALRHLYRVDAPRGLSSEGGMRPGDKNHPAISPRPFGVETPLLSRIPPEFPNGVREEDIAGQIVLPGNSPDSYAMFAYGDFMAPTIQDNDLIIFKMGEDCKNGDIVLVNSKWGELILRRYRIKADGVWLSSDNTAYTPFQPEPNLRIAGVVTDVWRKLKI